MQEIASKIAQFQSQRSLLSEIQKDSRFVKKLEREYPSLDTFEQRYEAHQEKNIANYKHVISTGLEKVMEEEKLPAQLAIKHIADDIDKDVRTNVAFQKTAHQFNDHLTWVWLGAQKMLEEVLEPATAE